MALVGSRLGSAVVETSDEQTKVLDKITWFVSSDYHLSCFDAITSMSCQ